MKTIITILFSLLVLNSFSQNQLEFNQVKIIDNTQDVVPADKVWKVTSVYGFEDICINMQNPENSTYVWRKVYETAFEVNGVKITSSLTDYQPRRWCNSNCNTCITNWPNDNFSIPADPNIIPMWLSAGTTVETLGPNTLLSVIEFNIIP